MNHPKGWWQFQKTLGELGGDLELLMLAKEELDRRIAVVRREKRQGGTSEAVEYVPYKDGHLQLTYHYTKKGTRRGPYWYFVYHAMGKQKSIYIGKCSVEEAKERVDEKRSQ